LLTLGFGEGKSRGHFRSKKKGVSEKEREKKKTSKMVFRNRDVSQVLRGGDLGEGRGVRT